MRLSIEVSVRQCQNLVADLAAILTASAREVDPVLRNDGCLTLFYHDSTDPDDYGHGIRVGRLTTTSPE